MKNLGYYIYLYFYLFVPVISGSYRKICYLLYFAIAIFVLLKHKQEAHKVMCYLEYITKSVMVLFAYVTINTFVNGADPIIFTADLSMIIVPYVSVLSFLALYEHKRRHNIASDLLTVSLTASIISLIMYISPSVGHFFRYLQAGDELQSVIRFYEDGRGYGIAGSLFFGYSIVQAIIVFISLIYIEGYKKYASMVIILASMLLNARIGLFLLVALLFVNYLFFTPITQIVKASFGIGIVVLSIIVSGIYKHFQHSIDWLMEGIYMTSDFLFDTEFGPSGGHFSGLADSFLIWPQGYMDWIFGSGEYILYGSSRGGSDIGLILQLNWGGLIFFVLLIVPYLYIIKKSLISKNYIFSLMVMISIAIGNWKGDLFMQSNFIFITICLFYILICKNEIIINNHSRLQ